MRRGGSGALEGARVLLTGASGFIGAHLVSALVHEGSEVAIVLNHGDNALRLEGLMDHLHVYHGDLTSALPIESALTEFSPDFVYHLAAAGVKPYFDPVHIMNTNVVGTTLLAELLRNLPHACRLIYTGSSFQYGVGDNLSEHHPFKPTTIYGASKAAGEILLQMYARTYGLDISVARLFTVYGPGERIGRLVPTVIVAALQQKRLLVTGGRQERDFVYISDIVQGLLQLASQKDASGKSVNLSSGHGISVRAMIEKISEVLGVELDVEIGALPYREGEIWNQSGDNALARKVLDWQPSTSLKSGIEQTANWYHDNLELALRLIA